jgi:hypothetical protein
LNEAGYCRRISAGALREVTCMIQPSDKTFENWTNEGGSDARQQEFSDVKARDESERQQQFDSRNDSENVERRTHIPQTLNSMSVHTEGTSVKGKHQRRILTGYEPWSIQVRDEKESEIKRLWKRAYRKIKQKDDEGRWLRCEPTRIRIRIRSRIRIRDRIRPDRTTLPQKEAR